MKKLIISFFLSFLMIVKLLSQSLPFNFNVGNCEHNGKVKSVSLYEYEQLNSDYSTDSMLIIANKVPIEYYEYNLDNKMVTHASNSSEGTILIKKKYNETGNIKYEIKRRFPTNYGNEEFYKNMKTWGNNLDSQADSIFERILKKDKNLEIVVYHYDYDNLLVVRMPYLYAPPTHLQLDKKGNIVNEKRFSYQYGEMKTIEILREYFVDKLLMERITNDGKQVFKRYLYNEDGNIATLIMYSEIGFLIRQEIYIYVDNTERVLLYDSNYTLTREVVKKKEKNSTTISHFKVDLLGNRDLSIKIIEFEDEFENVVKRYSFNSENANVKISEFHFEYY